MKNKILLISSIFILISFTFINSCFAYTSNDDYTTLLDACTEYTESHGYNVKNYIVFKNNNIDQAIYLLLLNDNAVSEISSSRNFFYANNYYFINFSDVDKEIDSSNTIVHDSDIVYDIIDMSQFNILYSSFDIYTDTGTLFFQKTPLKLKMEMAEIMKTAGEQATLEVGQIILIVIMITAGLTVLLIGLKKGLTVLMNGFRH